MKSSILVLSTLAVLINIFLFENNNATFSGEVTGIPAKSIFENEIIKPIYDSEILVHAIEQKLMR